MALAVPALDDMDIQKHATDVHRYIQESNLPKLKETLERLRLDDRNKVIHHMVDDRTAIFLACELQKPDIIKYILEESKVDIEQKGVIRGYRFEIEVTPLWCAAHRNSLDIIKILLEHGANLNARSENGSTAIMVACEMGFGHIVHYLVNQGADVNLADDSGVTCLREALDFPELCKFLITKGANVNTSHEGQYSLLHRAIKLGNLKSVKCLLEAEADTSVLDFDGNTPLLFAALCGHTSIVKLIIESTNATTKQIVDAYDILGAMSVFDGECKSGLHLWQAAILSRVPKSDSKTTSDINQTVINDLMKDLETLPCHPDAMQDRAIAIMEKILGTLHSDTIQKIMLHAVSQMHSGEYTKSMTTFMYGYDALVKKHKPLHLLQAYALTQMVQIIYNVWQLSVGEGARTFDEDEEDLWELNCIRILQYLVAQIQHGIELRTSDSQYFRRNVTTFYNFVYIALSLIHMSYEINDMIEYFIDFQKEIRKFLHIDVQHCDRKTMFHFAIEPIDTELYYGSEDYAGIPHPSPYVLKMLAQNGASVNAKDVYGNTPLNSYMQQTPSEKQDKAIVDLMLELGAHVDISNEDGLAALAFLKESKFTFCEVAACTLKCIAANIIVKHGIKYHGHIPNELGKFVEMHRW